MATLILKATEACNSNCSYCDVVRKKGSGSTMSLELLETVFRRIGEFLEEVPEESIDLLWHGGEPLAVGPGFFEKALSFQEKYCPGTRDRIRHSIQTNMTLFDTGFMETFRKLGLRSLGTSFDPEPHVRGFGPGIDTAAYNKEFMRGVRLAEENGFDWGMIYVATRKSLEDPKGVFLYLTNMLLTGGININPVLIYDEARKDIAISPEEFVEFLGAVFPLWWEHRDRYPQVDPFRSLVDTIIGKGMSLSCVDSGDCAYHHINVAPDGSCSQCGRSADWGLLDYGNVADRSLKQILADPQREQFVERLGVLRKTDCAGCRFWEICHGGCPLDSWSVHKDFMHKSEWCEARRGFIAKHFEPRTGVRFEPIEG
jgi:radical SAM protein with 4Fe4S-binding SPASM domain